MLLLLLHVWVDLRSTDLRINKWIDGRGCFIRFGARESLHARYPKGKERKGKLGKYIYPFV